MRAADLSVTQLCAAMRISLTTAKKIRAWSGLPCWPRVAILAGRCPGLSAPGIACGRLQMMTCARENDDMAAYEVLVRAHLSLCPDAFDPIPARLLDRLDDLLEDFD